ncbi:esterase-like activity of phytase family protein [Humitalea sp. 24SJ18S-53]|uniref:esterase-like activity of phytase family protein n=1 Tax=Humitalea sp. 24SJ18S-53 TaxID=3422307 RepID=UPI003D665FF0
MAAGGAWPRRGVLGAALAGLAGCRTTARGGPIATPLPPFATPPDSPLEALGGLEIDDTPLGFGGLSGLHIGDDLALTAISDTGHWLQARLALAAGGAPLGLEEVRHGPLLDGAGLPMSSNYQRDAESLARLPDGRWLVGFERWHRIRIYDGFDLPGAFVDPPPGLELAPRNGGLESLTVLADGRWFAIAEALRDAGAPDRRAAWLRGVGGGWQRTSYRPGPGLDATDACGLPDGGALVLERSFAWLGGFTSRMVRVSPAAMAAPVIEGQEVLRFTDPVPRDNFEGVATFRHGGRDCVAVVSDDNQNVLQRSLLLVLAWR